jgi:esterase/lipase superfamily enzyme
VPPIRWVTKFLRADADQPVNVARMLLAEIRWNQWVLLQWRGIECSHFYPWKKNELLPRLRNADPETALVQVLRLEQKSSCQTTLDRDTQPSALAVTNVEEPWVNRTVLLDDKGNPLAIGAPVVARGFRITQNLEVSPDVHLKSSYYLEQRMGYATPARTLPPSDVPRDYSIIRIFYATDRLSEHGGTAYSNKRDPNEILHFGTCDVTIPRDHRLAKLESPRWWRFEFHWDPRKHITLHQIHEIPQPDFFAQLQADVKKAEDHSAFVFIHGFNVDFEDAARRTAQLSYDLGFGGVPVLYSWPSACKLSGYMADETTIEWSKPHLAYFLSQISCRVEASTLHVIAHSMGNRVLLKILQALPSSTYPLFFNQILLTAPDIDSGEFMQIAASIQKPAERMTLYASSNDKAIQLSKTLHEYPRAGESGSAIVIANGVDTIDASSVDTSLVGHSYFAEERTVLSDVFYLFREGKPPSERHGLEEKTCSKGRYWSFRP